MIRSESSRCVLLFARASRAEAAAKGLQGASALFQYARRRLAAEVASLTGVDFIVAGDGAATLRQRGDSFGERLRNSFADARALGYRAIVAVPADAPALDASHLSAAFEALDSRDVALGRSPDGGVYLIGARAEVDALFRGVRWRTAKASADLMANAPDAAVLPDLVADVDRRADLMALRDQPKLPAELARLVRALLAPARPFYSQYRVRPAACFAAARPSDRSPPLLPAAH